jgi:cytochrome b involved in lipid metabolism
MSSSGSGPAGGPEQGDDINQVRTEISKLQMLERGLARSNRSLIMTPEGEEARIATRNSKTRRIIAMFISVALLVGSVFGIIAIVDHMKKNDIQFSQSQGGNTPVSLQELQAHNTEDDVWLVLHGDVYDLTSYSERHPGGAAIITDFAGKDGTELYDAFHPKELLRTVVRYKIGPLLLEEGTQEPAGIVPVQGPTDRVVTLVELSEHITTNDLWIAFFGEVYDLTSYHADHPGSSAVLLELGGTDGTETYRRNHPSGLLGILPDDSKIGLLQTSEGAGVDVPRTGDPVVGPAPGTSSDDEEDEDDSGD